LGPTWEKALKNKEAELEAKKGSLTELEEEVRKLKVWRFRDHLNPCSSIKFLLQKRVAEYKLHMEQFRVQRAYVKEIEDNLKPGEVLVYKDFVNQHIHGGGLTHTHTHTHSHSHTLTHSRRKGE
jgi:hypothetical protein